MTDLRAQLDAHKKKKRAESGVENNVSHADLIGTKDIPADNGLPIMKTQAERVGRYISLAPTRFYPDKDQPRKTIDPVKLQELQDGIELIGQIQPIVVWPADKDGNHKIIAGERRWRAISASDRVKTVDAIIMDTKLNVLKVLRIQIQENENRDNVSALETIYAIMRGVAICKEEDDSLTDKDIARLIGVNASTISKARAIFESSENVKSLAEEGVTQDTLVLYTVAKSHKENPEATNEFIESIKAESKSGERGKINLRASVKNHADSLKPKKTPKPSNSSESSKVGKHAKHTPNTKQGFEASSTEGEGKVTNTTTSADNTAHFNGTADDADFITEDGSTFMVLNLEGGKVHRYRLSDVVVETLSQFVN